jgi:hypothetical protein
MAILYPRYFNKYRFINSENSTWAFALGPLIQRIKGETRKSADTNKITTLAAS